MITRPDVVLRNRSLKQRLATAESWKNPEIRKARIDKIKTHTGAGKVTRGMLGKKHSDESKQRMSTVKIGMHLGDKHPLWKGEKCCYGAKHVWIKKHKKKLGICCDCGRLGPTQWSNVDHKYRRNLDDYVEKCPSCHKKYDIALKKHANNV